MDELANGPLARIRDVAHSASHLILVCKACRHLGDVCLGAHLRAKSGAATSLGRGNAFGSFDPGRSLDFSGNTGALDKCGNRLCDTILIREGAIQ